MDQKPSVGRIVHYTPDDSDQRPWAAIITRVSRDESRLDVNLTVFMPDGSTSPREIVEFSEKPQPGHWSWPPRV